MLEQEIAEKKANFRRIEKLTPDELLDATAMLVDIFLDGPLFLYAFPNQDDRKRALKELFLASLKDAEKFGIIEALEDEKLLSLFIYYPPNRYPMSIARVMRRLPHYLKLFAISLPGMWKLYLTQKFLDKVRPKTPHCHALFLGAVGNGKYGARLIRKALETIDANNWPVYLETQDPRTTRLYSRYGSKIVINGEEAAPGVPPTWTMWREPSR